MKKLLIKKEPRAKTVAGISVDPKRKDDFVSSGGNKGTIVDGKHVPRSIIKIR